MIGLARDSAGVLHIVGVSGGKDSTALALKLAEDFPATPFHYICTPTGDEPVALWAHWKRLEELLGKPLQYVKSGHTLNSLIEKFGALPNWRQRWCTRMLKIEPYIAFLKEQAKYGPVISYIGLRFDEEEDVREGVDYAAEVPGVSNCFYLREIRWGLTEVWEFLDERAICIPKRTDCRRCYGQRLPEWRDLYLEDRETYEEAMGQEDAVGHTFRSPGRDTWPASLADLAVEFERGRPMRVRRDERSGVCRACSL